MQKAKKAQTAKKQWGKINAQTLDTAAQKAIKGGNGSSADGDDIIIHEDLVDG
jgi:hypothetical protein